MKLLVVSNGFPPRGQWGTEYYTHQLVGGLLERGHEVAVLHPERSGSRPRYTVERVTSGGVPVFLLHNPGDPAKSFADSYTNRDVEQAFRSIVEEWRPDAVHFLYLLWGLSVRMPVICRELGVPSLVTLTDYGLLCHRGQMYDWRLQRCEGPHPPEVCARCVREPSAYDDSPARVLVKRLGVRALAAIGGAGRVVVTSDLAAREDTVREALAAAGHLVAPTRVLSEAFQRFGVEPERITQLVYSIDERPFAAAQPEPAPVGSPGNELRKFGFLGQFTPHKGLGTLLEAVRRMERRLPESVENWEVRLYGGPAGARHRHYAQAVLSSYRGKRVVVCEPFSPPEAPLILAGLHAVVLPSEWDENAPLTALQARAAGIPLIASDVRGIAEVVEHGVHGLLFPSGDAGALADAMREVVLGRLGRTGHVDLPVALSEHVDRIESLYERVRAEARGQ